MQRRRWMAVSVVLIGLILAAIRQMPAPLVDNNYMDALAAANRLLSAWQQKNGPAGLALMSPGLRRRYSKAELGQWVIGIPSLAFRSYEIGPGRRLTESRYQFRVRLLERSAGQKWGRPRKGWIVLTRNGLGQWTGEVLPCGPGDAALGGRSGDRRAGVLQ